MIYRPLNILPDNEYFAYGKTVKITWKNSGDMMKAFRIYVYNNSTDALVCDSKEITSYTSSYEITEHLEVGTYKYKIVVYNDIASNEKRESAESILKVFMVSPLPTVTLNLQEGDIISTQQLSLSANYSHPSGTAYKNYKFILYNQYKTVIEESPYLTDNNLEYTYSTLLDNKGTYYAQCMIITNDNIEAASDLVKFTAEYIKPTLNFALTTKTYPCQPYVELEWSITRILGHIEGDGYYIDIDGNRLSSDDSNFYNKAVKLNLTTSGAKAIFDEGITIEGDFTVNLWVEDIPTDGTVFFKMRGNNGEIYLNFYNNKVHCWKEIGIVKSHYMSNDIEYTGQEQLMIRIQQKDNRMDCFVKML